MRDKYGAGQDPYCYPGTSILRNRLDVHDDGVLSDVERDLSAIAANQIEFALPPYGLQHLQALHRLLFGELYTWAGELRTVDISKGGTRFCTVARIRPEAEKLFAAMAKAHWFEALDRDALVVAAAQSFGDLNVLHPFREGNGRAQRVLFEHLIVNAGFEIDWWAVTPAQWLQANIAAVVCDYQAITAVFDRCIGQPIAG